MEQKFGINSIDIEALREFCEREGKMVEYRKGDHPPVETFPRFYLVLLRQQIAPMEADGMRRVYQM